METGTEVRQPSEAGKGDGARKSTKESRKNFSNGYDNIAWPTKPKSSGDENVKN